LPCSSFWAWTVSLEFVRLLPLASCSRSVCLSVSLSRSLSLSLSVVCGVSVCLSVRLSACLSACLLVCLSVRPSVWRAHTARTRTPRARAHARSFLSSLFPLAFSSAFSCLHTHKYIMLTVYAYAHSAHLSLYAWLVGLRIAQVFIIGLFCLIIGLFPHIKYSRTGGNQDRKSDWPPPRGGEVA